MMFSNWLPWKYLIKRAVRMHGVIDPFLLMARLRRFAQPSEVQEPIELIRAGIIFHARGLINTRAIQHNMDWIWPYWVERQFNPSDAAFIPRGFSFTHVNLTHRNWTAVGQPDWALYPLVDPRGLVTALYDGWSLDFWVLGDDETALIPSKANVMHQRLLFEPNLTVETTSDEGGLWLQTRVSLEKDGQLPVLTVQIQAGGAQSKMLAVALRPYNPEGIQFIEQIDYAEAQKEWLVNNKSRVHFDTDPDRMLFSTYAEGDVFRRLAGGESAKSARCPVGLATAAAVFELPTPDRRSVTVRIPLKHDDYVKNGGSRVSRDWGSAVTRTARLSIPDKRMQFLYDSAVRTLILLSAEEIVPGPYTYRRFWFRDACLMMNALLVLGLNERCRKALLSFPSRQDLNGYFRSQDGEWDSNGQVLWIFDRYERLTGHFLPRQWLPSLRRAADWIVRKRNHAPEDRLHGGLLPPGFSAEHLGPNDYYYWDDCWGIAGLRSAARLFGKFGAEAECRQRTEEADAFWKDLRASIEAIPVERRLNAIPASPYRRMDSGAVGSLVADYPLQLTEPGDHEIMATVEFLMERCFYGKGFFQDMIHSGINAYLTLDIAQTLLRAGDRRHRELIEYVADLATETGQWPEAIHPQTGGGCMGDGQHGWAAAEWVMIMRSLFVREEADGLIFGSGLFPEWLREPGRISFGPTQTPWGTVSVSITNRGQEPYFHLEADWNGQPPELRVQVPGFKSCTLSRDSGSVRLEGLNV